MSSINSIIDAVREMLHHKISVAHFKGSLGKYLQHDCGRNSSSSNNTWLVLFLYFFVFIQMVKENNASIILWKEWQHIFVKRQENVFGDIGLFTKKENIIWYSLLTVSKRFRFVILVHRLCNDPWRFFFF